MQSKMNKRKDKINKRTLIDRARSSLDEEFGPIEPALNVSKEDKINYEEGNEQYKMGEKRDVEIRDKGDWECDISEITPPKKVKCVSMFTKLPSGLTPSEMMYGKKDDDHDYIAKSLE